MSDAVSLAAMTAVRQHLAYLIRDMEQWHILCRVWGPGCVESLDARSSDGTEERPKRETLLPIVYFGYQELLILNARPLFGKWVSIMTGTQLNIHLTAVARDACSHAATEKASSHRNQTHYTRWEDWLDNAARLEAKLQPYVHAALCSRLLPELYGVVEAYLYVGPAALRALVPKDPTKSN